jgi:hypothetical protein
MATTTNYSWETPDDTDLVKDGAAAIRTLGSSIDTTTKALNPSTTLGDIEYRSSTANTNTRLGIGSTGNVLTVAGGVPTWAAPAAAGSGLNFISRTTFSNVATRDFDGVFTSSYYNYLFVIETLYAGTSGDDLFIQFRYAGPTTQATGYYGSSIYASYLNTSVTNDPTNNNTALRLSRDSSSSGAPGSGYFYVNNVGNASEIPNINGQYFTAENGQGSISQGGPTTARTYTGFRLLSGSSNITGAVSIYGLAKA